MSWNAENVSYEKAADKGAVEAVAHALWACNGDVIVLQVRARARARRVVCV